VEGRLIIVIFCGHLVTTSFNLLSGNPECDTGES